MKSVERADGYVIQKKIMSAAFGGATRTWTFMDAPLLDDEDERDKLAVMYEL